MLFFLFVNQQLLI